MSAQPHAALAVAIVEAVDRGRSLPCGRPDVAEAFTSDDRETRAAARLCTRCPVLAECARAGQGETFGIWGGVDVDGAR